MPLFRKVIARPGSYLVNSPSGQRTVKTFTKEDLKKTAETANKMISDGYLIPAPYGHRDGKGVHPIPLLKGTDGEFLDSYTNQKPRWDQAVNAGFWKSFEYGDDGSLIGVLEVDGDFNDDSTHAGRIGKTFKQTSMLFMDAWTDGKGILREKVPLHVCVTNKAVEPNQPNFENVEDSLTSAMSFSMDDAIGDSSIDEKIGSVSEKLSTLLTNLKSKLDIILPADTNDQNIFDRLITVLVNMKSLEEDKGLTNDPESETLSPPAIMSADTKTAVDETKMNLLLGKVNQWKQESCKSRIDRLVSTGKIGKAYAEKSLYPLVNSISMSLDDMDDKGNFGTSPLEMSLDILDQNVSLTDSQNDGKTPSGSETLDLPKDVLGEGEDMSDEDMKQILKETLQFNSYSVMS